MIQSEPAFRQGYKVDVVQLATRTHGLVIQLKYSAGDPNWTCRDVLHDMVIDSDGIIKVGVGIDDDLLRLAHTWGVHFLAPNRLDLGGIVPMISGTEKDFHEDRNHEDDPCLSHASTMNQTGLRTATTHVLGLDLPKSRRIAVSNWARTPLSHDQVVYAARDAWAALAVADCLALVDPDRYGAKAWLQRFSKQESYLSELQSRRKTLRRVRRAIRRLSLEQKEQQPPEGEESRAELEAALQENLSVEPPRIQLSSLFALHCSSN